MNIAIDNGPFSSFNLPIKNGGFPLFYVCLPEGIGESIIVLPTVNKYILIILPPKKSKYGEVIGKTHVFTQKYGEDSGSKA